MPAYDAILIPGGGLLDDGGIPPWVAGRLHRAMERRGEALLIPLSAGTTHKPRLEFESVAGARYLLARGVPASHILVEALSYDTIGNAWFSRVLHAEPRRLRRLLIVSSQFHIARCEAVFRWVYSLAPSPVEFTLDFEAVPDEGISSLVLEARHQRETASRRAVAALAQRYRDVASFHQWLYTEHAAYAAGSFVQPPPPVSGPVLDTY